MSVELHFSIQDLVHLVHEQEGMDHKVPGIFQLVIPAELVEDTLNEPYYHYLASGDIVIDHGSNFKDSQESRVVV